MSHAVETAHTPISSVNELMVYPDLSRDPILEPSVPSIAPPHTEDDDEASLESMEASVLETPTRLPSPRFVDAADAHHQEGLLGPLHSPSSSPLEDKEALPCPSSGCTDDCPAPPVETAPPVDTAPGPVTNPISIAYNPKGKSWADLDEEEDDEWMGSAAAAAIVSVEIRDNPEKMSWGGLNEDGEAEDEDEDEDEDENEEDDEEEEDEYFGYCPRQRSWAYPCLDVIWEEDEA